MKLKQTITVALVSAGIFTHSVTAQHSRSTQKRSAKNIVETAASAGEFKTLIAAAKAAGLAGALTGQKPLTVLAPTDAAFAKLGKDAIRSLLRPENKAKLAAILSYHVIPGRVSAAAAIQARAASTLLTRGRVRFSIRNGRLRVQNANVIKNDIAASNGTIHVLDTVLMPPSSLLPKPGRKVVGIFTERPSKALAAQLGIDRNRASVITRTTSKGPARKAGLQAYDVVISIDGRSGTSSDLSRAKDARGVGEEIELVVIRRGKRKHFWVPVALDRH